MAADGRPGVFKFAVYKDTILLPYGRVIDMPGLAGCMSWAGELYMT